MLTTKPWMGAGGGAGGGGGGDDAPMEPRKISGSPRLEQTYELGTLTVIATYDNLKEDLAADLPISLVGYKSDDTMSIKVQSTAKDGRTEFRNLDRTGNTVYFVLAQLPRNGALDRAFGFPLQMDSRGGVHMVLSGEKRASTERPADDFGRVQAQTIPTPADKVRVVINGVPEYPATVRVYDLTTRQELAHADAAEVSLDAGAVNFQSQYAARTDLPAGFLGIVLHGGAAGTDKPMAKETIEIIPGDGPLDSPMIASPVTEVNGQAIAEKLPTGVPYRVRVKVRDKVHVSEPFDLTASGGAIEILASWGDKGRIEAVLDVPHVPGRVLYAECINRKHMYRSVPFQTLPGVGTQLSMFFYPRILFTFGMGGQVEDQLLGLRGQLTIQNYSWAPYRAPGDGLVIPLPKHAKGIFVDEGDQTDVSVETGVGFRMLRPIPPGGRKFGGGFSLPIDGGEIDWNMDLPMGTYQSSLRILKTPGMFIKAPANAPLQEGTVEQGEIYQISPLTIGPQQSMQLSIIGLPVLPAWRLWVPRILGIGVILILGVGIAFAMFRRRESETANADTVARAAQREKLLEDLVALDRVTREKGDSEKTRRRRETLITELEALWGHDAGNDRGNAGDD
ncbi:MAG: hypothetical protein NT062_16015 [Proteobacteria bacterium]|nr:hypothetical protein [Pseudomonadota bacterium]